MQHCAHTISLPTICTWSSKYRSTISWSLGTICLPISVPTTKPASSCLSTALYLSTLIDDRWPMLIFRAWATCDSIEEQKNWYQQNITFFRVDERGTENGDPAKVLLRLTDLTFQDSSDYEIVKEGFNYRHCEFYLYKFNVDRIIGYSIEAGQFTKHIGIFYTYRPCDGDQFNIVTSFPY